MSSATPGIRKSPEFRKALEAFREAADDLQSIAEMYSRVDHPAETSQVVDMLASGLLLREIVRDLYDESFGRDDGISLVWAIRNNLDIDTPTATAEATEDVTEADNESPAAGPRIARQDDAAESTPRWYQHTPRELMYSLEVFDPDGSGETEEVVWVSRAEYIMLKRVLAEHRGLEHDLSE